MLKKRKIVIWFSAGITSTVATKLTLDKFGHKNVDIVFFETGSHHPDNSRFISECEEIIFKKKVKIIQNKKYDTVLDVLRKGYINSPGGAYCTKVLKKDMRFKLEKKYQWEHQVFGFEFDKKEINRALRFKEQYPSTNPLFPLIEIKMNKAQCIEYINSLGIELPMMYRLGYTNNNCVGCVKGGDGILE
jgi:3'-phosphoadenosine 5'-phosphosulfate sulfotransferase (PAPS reductase)/FAD synthetase